MRYRQLGQSWTDATIVNLIHLGLLLAVVVLYITVKGLTMKKRCGHCHKTRHFPWWEVLFKNCYGCRRTIRIGKAINKKYGGAKS